MAEKAETKKTKEGSLGLKRQLGLSHGVAIIVGLVVGGGIYITPRGVMLYSKSPGLTLVMWAIGGVVSLLGALSYAEIGLVYPVSGEKYAYLGQLYGPFVAFIYIWQYLFLTRAGGNTVKALMLGRYLLKPFFPDCEVPPVAISLVATIFTCLLTTINCISVKLSARGQNLMTSISLLTLGIISVSGIVYICQGNTEHLENSFEGSTTDIGDIVLAMYSTVYAYYGWTALNFLIEELKNPLRNLPWAIAISIFLSTLMYVLVNLTYVAVLGKEGVITSEAVAISVAIKTLGPIAWMMPILIATTATSSFNSGLLCGSRLSFVGARQGYLPKVLGLINIRFVTPFTSIVLQCLMAVMYIWSVDVYRLINNLVFSLLFFDLLVVVAYVRARLRNQVPTTPKTTKLPIAIPILYSSILLILVTVPLVSNFKAAATGLVLTAVTSIPYYVIFFCWKRKPEWIERRTAAFNKFVQKLLYCAPQNIDTIKFDE